VARLRLTPYGIAYVLVLTALLVVPADAEWHAQREHRWLATRLGLSPASAVRDFVLNVGIFVPIGVMVALRRGAGRAGAVAAIATAIGGAAAFSIAAETAQFWLAWRASSLADVVANTLGAGAGAALTVTGRQAVRASATPKTGLSVRSTSDSSPSVGNGSE